MRLFNSLSFSFYFPPAGATRRGTHKLSHKLSIMPTNSPDLPITLKLLHLDGLILCQLCLI
ncbi:hypothetical protein, partial [Paenibacillus sp. MY03]|uniref:hypothetical protein n=1 Tax=Paenibacillus sp. MY03 TaxID=302980 RepID=UPI001C4EB18B